MSKKISCGAGLIILFFFCIASSGLHPFFAGAVNLFLKEVRISVIGYPRAAQEAMNGKIISQKKMCSTWLGSGASILSVYV